MNTNHYNTVIQNLNNLFPHELSESEWLITKAMIQGANNKWIAEHFGYSDKNSLKLAVHNIYNKLVRYYPIDTSYTDKRTYLCYLIHRKIFEYEHNRQVHLTQ